MEWLGTLYPAVQTVLRNAIPEDWPELGTVLDALIEGPMLPEASLPLASCRAVGGRAEDAVHVAAAVVAAATSLRMLDDLEDQDRPGRLWNQLGPARAWNYAAGLYALSLDILNRAPLSTATALTISRCFTETFLRITSGQDRDLAGQMQSMDAYRQTVERKIASAYAAGCMVGALVGTNRQHLIEACGVFGHHLGFAIQLLNDLESIWHPDGATDLQQGKVTLPVLYGLTIEHAEREELRDLVRTHRLAAHGDRVRAILDHIDARTYLIWAALRERERALEVIRICPDRAGREALEAYVTGMFGDIDALLVTEGAAVPTHP